MEVIYVTICLACTLACIIYNSNICILLRYNRYSNSCGDLYNLCWVETTSTHHLLRERTHVHDCSQCSFTKGCLILFVMPYKIIIITCQMYLIAVLDNKSYLKCNYPQMSDLWQSLPINPKTGLHRK